MDGQMRAYSSSANHRRDQRDIEDRHEERHARQPVDEELVDDEDGDEVDIDRLKWLVLMVLSSQPGQEQACARMEDLVFEDSEALPN